MPAAVSSTRSRLRCCSSPGSTRVSSLHDVPQVVAIHVHPVKSCHRVEVDEAVIGAHGLVGDREWQLIDPGGGFLTQRAHPILARVHPELTATGVVLRVDGQSELAVDRPPRVDRTAHTYTGDVP